jgi:hypothetical protein
MARALETLDQALSRLEKGEISAIEAIDELLAKEQTLREGRRIGAGLRTARLTPIKTLDSFDFSFQPSLDRHRIMALAQLKFIKRAEVLHGLGPRGTGKSHLATALGIAAVKAGLGVHPNTLGELIEALSKAEHDGRLAAKIRFHAPASLLIAPLVVCQQTTAGPWTRSAIWRSPAVVQTFRGLRDPTGPGSAAIIQPVNARCEKGPRAIVLEPMARMARS